ncbi:MAG TPA: S8 family serine peptidase, partial [Solirubrobacterales bacterium]
LISPARTFEFTTDSAGANVSIDLGDTLVAGGAIRIRLSLIADAANGGSVGVHMDNIELRCAESPSDNGFLFLQGTSMAAPHVAGAAGLLFSRNAGAGAAEIRDKLLSTVDPNAALSGITTTGGRLNIGTAMARMPADTAITGGPGEGEVIGGRRSARGRSSPPGAFASFGVASNDPAAGFQCSVDGAAFAACGAGGTATVGPLGPGPHSFAVRSVDPRGNADTTPATRAFAVETDPPETRIVKGPKKRTTARKAKFRFRSDEPGSTFECKYDRKPFKPCTSPRKLKRVKVGRHKFLVRATDGVGNVDTSAAKKRWRVKK